MVRFPILKALSGSQKVFKLLGVGLDKRQGLIVLSSVFVYWLLYRQLSGLVALTTAQAVVLFAPLVVGALAIAFVRHDGYHLDWWIQMKARNYLRPNVLFWRRSPKPAPSVRRAEAAADKAVVGKNPGKNGALESVLEGGGPGTASKGRKGSEKKKGRSSRKSKKPSDKTMRDSIQEAMPTDRFFWEMLRTEDGTYVLVFEVEPVSLGLSGDAQKERVWDAMAQLYNRIDFPLIEISRSREGSVNRYTEGFKDKIRNLVGADEHRLARFARTHLRFLETIVPSYNVYDRTGYVVLPYRVESPDRSRRKRRPSERDAYLLQKEAEEAYTVLSERAQIIFDAFTRVGARLRVLTDLELLAFLKDQTVGHVGQPTNPEDPPLMWEPVTLEVGSGYQKTSEARRAKLIAAAERARADAPPALGTGDLTVSDRISPDAVRVHADYLRVGDTYHATLFVYDFMPDVAFGDFQSLLHIPGRVKAVKYIKPLDQNKAVDILGSKVAELEAAEYTASDGNVISRQQRANARHSSDVAMEELLTGKQSYLELSMLFHCEANSREELNSLVQTVRTRLAGIRCEAKLAREQAWEGFLSALPLGVNHLARRYANKGFLTNALACVFIYGTYQVNHAKGVLLGLNPMSGSLVVLDSRRLMNPHMVVLGTSGGGKTQTVKALSTRLRMRGHRIVTIDPEGNSGYGRVARALDGAYVVFGIGSSAKFNPCAIHDDYLNLNLLAGADEDTGEESARRQARASALDGKVLMLTRLVSLMISSESASEGLSAGEQGLIDRLWGEVYAERGITDDPDTHQSEPPTFRDFFRCLARRAEAGDDALRPIRDKLYPWESGALKTVFDSQTNVDLDNKYLVLQIAGVKGRAKAAIMYALLDFLNGQLSNSEEPADCFVDEFWSLLKYPMAAEFAEELWRSGRARNTSMVAITQEIEEFLESAHGRVIMRLSASQLFLKQPKKTTEMIDDFVELSTEQKQALINAQSGEGFLAVEDNEVPLYVVCSPEEHRLFNTDPEKEAEYARRERRELAEARRLGSEAEAPLDAASGHAPGRTPEPHDPTPDPGDEEGFDPLEEQSPSSNGADSNGADSNGADSNGADSNGADSGAPRTERRITRHGRARRLLAGDGEDFVPAPDDYETVVIPDRAAPASSPEESGGDATDFPTSGVPDDAQEEYDLILPVAQSGDAPVIAVSGEGAGVVGYNLAGLLAASNKPTEDSQTPARNVLFVDAEGGMSEALFGEDGHVRPDDLLTGGGGRDFESYTAYDPSTNLRLLAHPKSVHSPAHGLVGLTLQYFDAVVVACWEEGRYGRDWLSRSSAALASGSSADALARNVARSEEARATDGTLLAALGAVALGPRLLARECYRLPARESEELAGSLRSGAYASLGAADEARAFRALLVGALRQAITSEKAAAPAERPAEELPVAAARAFTTAKHSEGDKA